MSTPYDQEPPAPAEKKIAKCKRGAHRWGATADDRYEKCYFCPAIRNKKNDNTNNQ